MSVLKFKSSTDDMPPQPLVVAEGFNPVTQRDEQWRVLVRGRTRREEELLFDRCAVRQQNRFSGRMEPVLDDRKWNTNAPDFYIAGWEDCTASALRSLTAFEEEPPVDDKGHVVYTPEVARELWRGLSAAKFADPIIQTSREVFAVRELEKKTALKG